MSVPAYWSGEITASVNTVISNINTIINSSDATPRTSTFFFITDTHWRGNAKNSPNVALQVAEAIDLIVDNDNSIPASFKTRLNTSGYRKLIFAGDSIKGNAGTKDGAREEAGAFLDAWDSSFHLATALGNHDTNREGSNPTENRLTSDEMYDLFLARESNYVTRDNVNKDTYIGWFDDTANKIRYFTFRHYDSTNLSSTVWNTFTGAINEIKNNGWGAIFFCHTFWGLNAAEGMPDALNIPDGSIAFATNLTDICCSNGVVPIALMVGHIHTDNSYVLITTNGNKLLVTSTVCDTHVNERTTIVPAPVMNAGDSSEQAFEVVQIDMNSGKLYLTRVGAGFDRVFNIPEISSSVSPIDVPVINPETWNGSYDIMSVKFVNQENLQDFWNNAKNYVDTNDNTNRQEIEDQLYNWQKTEKAPVVQCEPVPNSDLHPIVDFMFTETLPAEGEKGPENPSSISGVSSLTVALKNKNMTTVSGSATINGVVFTDNGDGSVTANGSATSDAYFHVIQSGFSSLWRKKGLTYHLSGCPSSGSFDLYYITALGGTGLYDAGSGGTVVAGADGNASCAIVVKSGTTVSNVVFKPQLEFGSEATSFEKGINAYVENIPLGSTYYGGSIDIATGLMTVTHWGFALDGTEQWRTVGTVGSDFRHDLSNSAYPALKKITRFVACSHFSTANSGDLRMYISGVIGGSVWYLVCVDTNAVYPTTEAWKSFLANQHANGTPVTLAYKLAEPYTVQLTPQQIKSLASLEGTSKRINTLYTDVDSIQVEYQKYVGIDSTLDSDSVNAIQNKVVNSALNTKVSLSGDETISGTKTFSNTINGSITGDAGTVAGHIVSKDVPVNAAFTDTTYDPATQSTAGLMSASDKVKLDAVGSVFSFKGSVIDDTYLPTSDNVNGDAYLAEDTGHVHVYDGTNFVDIGIWAGIPSATDAQIDALFED